VDAVDLDFPKKELKIYMDRGTAPLSKEEMMRDLELRVICSNRSKALSSWQVEKRRISIVKEYILDNYNKDIQVQELAALLNLNPVYFGSYFKKKTGYTVRQYINKVRIEAAKKLLFSGRYSVGEVAYKCGFKDMFYFSRVFKQIEGVPPSHLLK